MSSSVGLISLRSNFGRWKIEKQQQLSTIDVKRSQRAPSMFSNARDHSCCPSLPYPLSPSFCHPVPISLFDS